MEQLQEHGATAGVNRLEGFLSPPQLAERLGVSLRTLSRWHAERTGPPRITRGRLVLYRLEALHKWLESHEGQARTPTRHRERGR